MRFSFLGKGQESPALQLYGKLPVAKDYLRIGCGEGSAREVREWLDRTFGALRSDDEELDLDEPLRFLGLGKREPLQGCLWPSTDAGGHRKFPFTLFVERRAKALLADLDPGRLSQAESVWRQLDEIRERCLAAPDGERLLAAQRGRELDLEAFEEASGAAADLDAWVGALWPEERQDGLHGNVRDVERLARGGHAGPYRLPLVRELPLRDQVGAWTAVLQALGALPADEVPTLFFPPHSLVSSGAPASLVVSRDPLDDERIVWLTRRGREESLGPADFAQRRDVQLESGWSPPEATVWLRDSLQEALVEFQRGGS